MRHSNALSPLLSVAVVGALVAGAPLEAQESTTRGFNVGLHLSGQSLTPEDGDRQNAGGAGLIVGYGFNRTVELFLQLDGGEFDVDNAAVEGDWTMGHADLGVRFHFANSLRSWVPYLQAALSGRAVKVTNGVINTQTQTEDITLSGGAFTLGGGILFYFSEAWALDLQLAWSGGRFTDITVGDLTYTGADFDAQTARFNLGASWWP
jgi:opacity protein-like surface antigen